jgi:hypothetical protein
VFLRRGKNCHDLVGLPTQFLHTSFGCDFCGYQQREPEDGFVRFLYGYADLRDEFVG